MNTPLDDDALTTLLKDDAHLEDGGFSDRVMGRLPRPRHALGRREAILAGSALIAAAAGALTWSGFGDVAAELARSGWAQATALALVVGLGLWGAIDAATSET